MKAAGGYVDRLEWFRKTPDRKDAVGQRADAFPSQGFLWGAVEDLSGGRASAKESERQEVTATVRLHGWPPVAAGDRLVDGWGQTWTVGSAYPDRPANETVCDVTRPRWTTGGGTTN